MDRALAKVVVDGRPVSWLGVNFWSRRGGPFMWRDYDGPTITEELRVLRDHGIDTTRSFAFWPDFQPAPDVVDPVMLDRYADFVRRHHDLGMATIPTFIVGHMSGQNWDPVWRGERDLYADVWLVARQAAFAGAMVKRLTDQPGVAGWLLSNEMPIYGRPPHEGGRAPGTSEVTAWVELMISAVRAAGGTQPLSTGDGAWGVETTGIDNGFAVRAIAPLVDFLGPHVYPMDSDVVRLHLSAAFVCELLGFAGRPVVLEEFGVTTDFVSGENAAHYYRQTLHNSLLAGATGWLAWNNTDYDDLAQQEPYSHHPFEMHFGITDADGAPKSPLLEMAAFRRVLDQIDVVHCRRPPAAAAVIVPSYVEVRYPFTQATDQTTPVAALRQSYVAAREADLPVSLVRELDGLPADAALLIVPSLKQLTAPTWRRLAELAEGGAVVYASYFAGGHGIQRGSWHGDLNRFFGVRHTLTYGLADTITADTVTMRFTRDFGDIPSSTVLTFAAAGTIDGRSFLPLEPVDARVVAVDQDGRPALLVREVGAGRVVLSTYPLEYLAAQSPRVNPEATHVIYGALAELAGITRDVIVDDPLVHVGALDHEDGTRFVWLVSQSAAELVVKPRVAAGWHLLDLTGGPPRQEIALAPYAVAVLRLEAS